MTNYDDIIGLPHHVSETREPMTMEERAGQFAPFAALTGYEDEVAEAGRPTGGRLEPDEDRMSKIDGCLQFLTESAPARPYTVITYFQEDQLKEGGDYVIAEGEFKYIEEESHSVVLVDGTKIPIEDIYDIAAQGLIS